MRRTLFFLTLLYLVCYVWPGRWRYDHVGGTPVRTERVTGRVQFCNLHGWQWQLPPIGGDPDDAPYKAPR